MRLMENQNHRSQIADILFPSCPDGESQLIGRTVVASGDLRDKNDYFKPLCEKLGPKIRNKARFAFGATEDEAKDVSQIVLITLIKKISAQTFTYQGEKQFYSYLNKLTLRNLTAVQGRSKVAKATKYDSEKLNSVEQASSPYRSLLSGHGVFNLDDLLDTADLTEDERTLLRLECEDVHYTEIAETMNIAISTYYKIKREAIEKLQEVWLESS